MSAEHEAKPDPTEEESPTDGGPSPGAVLRSAREACGLTVEEVAVDLHLHVSQIHALEADEHDRFPAPIFVQGHVRKYARRVGIDPEPLIAALRPGPVEQPPPLKTAGSIARRRAIGPEIWGGALLLGVVLVLALLWMLTRGEPRAPEPPMESEAPTGLAALPQEEPGDFDAGVLETLQAPPEEEAVVTAPPPPAVAQLDRLVLRFTGRSWVEISDATGRRLAVRMGEEGEEIHLQGQAPFDVLLGNAPNVHLEYNGSPYTEFRASRQNVANFRVGSP